jgi:dolichol-phosphate mannosyltransferase
MSELSIVIPILNEAKNIRLLIPEINKVKTKLKIKRFEVLLIDDNSHDNIKQVFNILKKKYKFLKLFIRKNKKKDLSKSCIVGFDKSSFKNILVMDGDFQHPPIYINKMYRLYIEKNYDFVIGSRDLMKRKNYGLSKVRWLFSIILIFLINLLLGNKTKDPMSGFFIFKKKIFLDNKNKLFSSGYKILSDLIYSSKSSLKIKDIFIRFDRRTLGRSKMNFNILLILLFFIVTRFFKKS